MQNLFLAIIFEQWWTHAQRVVYRTGAVMRVLLRLQNRSLASAFSTWVSAWIGYHEDVLPPSTPQSVGSSGFGALSGTNDRDELQQLEAAVTVLQADLVEVKVGMAKQSAVAQLQVELDLTKADLAEMYRHQGRVTEVAEAERAAFVGRLDECHSAVARVKAHMDGLCVSLEYAREAIQNQALP